ncbi:MAG: PIG-L family deacetylase [Saprospiraceae bacterium]|nr:PIG-L family deacetylase [Saprospiraceae bacterium]
MKFNKSLHHILYKTQGICIKNTQSYIISNIWKANRVWVLSPHPDDDAIGCGGAIIKTHIQMGHDVRIVYLCSGDQV